MVRKKSPQAVTAKMYTHFAVITLALTGALALATDGDRAEDFNQRIDERQAQVTKSGKDVKAYGEPKVVRKMANANEIKPAASGWGPDNFSLDVGSGGFTSSAFPSDNRVAKLTDEVLNKVGLTKEQFGLLSAQEQQLLLRQLTGGKLAVTAEERQDQIERIANASRARSGGSGSCADC